MALNMGEVLLDAEDMRRTLGRVAHEILEGNHGADNLFGVSSAWTKHQDCWDQLA